jgi:tRNA nucleotidyltransferase/poly(A) polymerase
MLTSREETPAEKVFSFCRVSLYERKKVSHMIINGAKAAKFIHDVYADFSRKNCSFIEINIAAANIIGKSVSIVQYSFIFSQRFLFF